MTTRTDTFDLGALRLTSGEGRRVELRLGIEPYELAGHRYTVTALVATADAQASIEAPAAAQPSVGAEQIPAVLNISRMTGQGYALRLTFDAVLHGPCMRCLEPADAVFHVDAREVSQPGDEEAEDEFESPYVLESILDVGTWARDALALVLPATLLHAPDCLGLCPICGADLNTAGPEHHHEPAPDPRWAALSELTFEAPPEEPDSGSSAA